MDTPRTGALVRRLWLFFVLVLFGALGCAPPVPPPKPPPVQRTAGVPDGSREPAPLEMAGSDTPPTPDGLASGTAAVFAGGGIRGRFAVSHGRLLASGTRPMHAELRLRADEETESARAPAAFALVIDTSGSMAGQKMDDARRSALALLEEMRDDDAVSIVRFSDDAEVIVPLRGVREVRAHARLAIGRLRASGNTNIARGLAVAASELASADGRIKRVAIVTDGRDTSGAPRGTAALLARRASERGLTISALGIGIDYDDAYLGDLAAAGHGNYEFLRDSSALARFLSKELRETARTTADHVVVDLRLPPGVRVRDVWGATWEPSPGGARLVLGALFAGDERRVIVALDAEVGEPGSALVFGAAASWIPAGGRRVHVSAPSIRVEAVAAARDVDVARDLSVLASVTSVITSRREKEAAAALEQGDAARAVALNRENLEELDRAAHVAPKADGLRLRAQRKAYDDDARLYAAPPAAGAAPAAARAIGARERKNEARDAAY
jgi:Ca-activated chloride channel homolog